MVEMAAFEARGLSEGSWVLPVIIHDYQFWIISFAPEPRREATRRLVSVVTLYVPVDNRQSASYPLPCRTPGGIYEKDTNRFVAGNA